MSKLKVALFDLDGVIIDTENQYSHFWGTIGKEYHPDVPDFAERIKGTTLISIYTNWFAHLQDKLPEITQRLNEFESQMEYNYIRGAREFIITLKEAGIHTAIVTASDEEKMQRVLAIHPEFTDMFDYILTSKDYTTGKPAPDCYLKGAEIFEASPRECVVFEDSINGLHAGRESGAYVVALTTTNSYAVVSALANLVINDLSELTLPTLLQQFEQQR